MNDNQLDKYDEHYRMLSRKFRVFAVIVITAITLVAVQIRNAPEYQCSQATIIVKDGETIWNIAERECTGNTTRAVDYLVDKYGTTIYAGQAIQLPTDGDDQ